MEWILWIRPRYFTPDDLIVQFRAERRSGNTDFGTNRQRLEEWQPCDSQGGAMNGSPGMMVHFPANEELKETPKSSKSQSRGNHGGFIPRWKH